MPPKTHYCINQENIDKLARHQSEQQQKIDKLYIATFGDVVLGEKGDHDMIKELHKFILQGNAVKKFVFWVFGVGALLITAVYEVMHTMNIIKKD